MDVSGGRNSGGAAFTPGNLANLGRPAASSSIGEGGGNSSAFAPGSSGPALPPVSLPSGGGAIRGMGESVAVNAVEAKATVTIPIPTSKARGDTEPQLSLEYSSGGGTGPWGIGWSLARVPDVTRSTRTGMPTYDDEKDVFVFSDADDLVPLFNHNVKGNLVRSTGADVAASTAADGNNNNNNNNNVLQEKLQDGFIVRQYGPRIEGFHGRIERWTDHLDLEDVHWRVFTPANEMVVFGRDANSRIMSAAGNGRGENRIFSWLCCEWYDGYGNARVYEYKKGDAVNVDLSQANEQNRTAADRETQRYLKRVKYGNREALRNVGSAANPDVKWMFEVVFDYGEHDPNAPKATESPGRTWACRKDPVSSFVSGFEVRTYRLCQRVLMFHHFKEELGQSDYLTKALELEYDEEPAITYLKRVREAGFVLRGPDDPQKLAAGSIGPYFVKRLPPLELEYERAPSYEQLQQLAVQEFNIGDESMNHVPSGLQGSVQWVDLLGEGISGILANYPRAWYYKRNLSATTFSSVSELHNGNGSRDDAMKKTNVPKFGSLECVTTIPSLSCSNEPTLLDLSGDGRVSFVSLERPLAGFYRGTADLANDAHAPGIILEPFRPFNSLPNQDINDPNLRFIDLTGDGKADILISQDNVFTWYESLGEGGFAPARITPLSATEELGPRILFSDPEETIHLADFNGDGLPDIVRIRNGEVCFWPNMGYGRFGAKVVMDNSPVFDGNDAFSPKRLLMGDVDGSGTTDLIYFHPTGARLYFNLAGNSWSDPIPLPSLIPFYDSLTTVDAVDILGSGTMCLVWSSSHQEDQGMRSMRYVDFTGGRKPHLLTKLANNVGKETQLLYCPSTTYYFQDLEAGTPWATRLPYPYHCLDRMITYDKVSRVTLSQRYHYRHGYYDSIEHEFRGFGMVEQWDTEEFDSLNLLPAALNTHPSTYTPPTHTKTWFHTGAFADYEALSRAYAREYYGSPDPASKDYVSAFETFFASQLRDDFQGKISGLSTAELREASRALKGSILRSEVYADDGSPLAKVPYRIEDYGNAVRMMQGRRHNSHGIFQVYAREHLNHELERNPRDPRITHSIQLAVDEFGNDLESATISYGRSTDGATAGLDEHDVHKQRETQISYTRTDYTNPVLETDDYRTPQVCRTKRYEISNFAPPDAARGLFTPSDFTRIKDFKEIPYDQDPDPKVPQKRVLEHVEAFYRRNDLRGDLKLGELESMGLPGQQYTLCLTPSMISFISKKIDKDDPDAALAFRSKGGYVDLKKDDNWWIPSPRTFYHSLVGVKAVDELSEARKSFFAPKRIQDEFGNQTLLRWDPHILSCTAIEDALGNTTAGELDYRTLKLCKLIDPNSNIKEVALDALGMVTGLAIRGKEGEKVGDTMHGFRPDLTESEVRAFFENPESLAPKLLAGATRRFIYDVNSYAERGGDFPNGVCTMVRTEHHYHGKSSSADGTGRGLIELSISYLDGHGSVIQKKTRAESPPSSPQEPRWRCSSWTVLNNKGLPVQAFEPYFDSTREFQFNRRHGVCTLHVYDALSRPVAVILPNKTWTKTVEKSWQNALWDTNDTVTVAMDKDEDVGMLVKYLPKAAWEPSWYNQRKDGQLGLQEKIAAIKAAAHANTPTVTHFDAMGRVILVLKDNGTEGKIPERIKLDIEGNILEVRDGLDRVVTSSRFSMAGQTIYTNSMDSGPRWQLMTARGEQMLSWDARGHRFRTEYDELRRQVEFHSQRDGTERLVLKSVYGETQPNAQAFNLREKVFREHDQAGVVTWQEWDFKGNALAVERQFASDYKTVLDWTELADVALEPDVYTTRSTYDAVNRVIAVTNPDGSVVRKSFGVGGFLYSVTGALKGDSHKTTFLAACEYDAYGRAVVSTAGNNTTTTNTFDPLTRRLVNLTVVRRQKRKSSVVQNLTYTHDPVGNSTFVRNDAEQTVFFRNGAVEPHSEYSYDAIYRLTEATGREHVGQTRGAPSGPGLPSSASLGSPVSSPRDGKAMVRYTEQYKYDAADNMTVLRHRLADPKFPSWTRRFSYETAEGRAASNRLVSMAVGNAVENYTYDANGNMKSMPNLLHIAWDCTNQLRRSSQQQLAHGVPETTWYVYDGHGQRVRKVTERQAKGDEPGGPRKLQERRVIGDFEVYRKYGGDGTEAVKRCETLHVRDGQTLYELVENWSGKEGEGEGEGEAGDKDAVRLIRFQYHDQSGSVNLELDKDANLVSYEEFTPYGSTSYHSLTVHAPKRFRYAAKERDDESGFYYFGLRYYLPWLARWMSPDPVGIQDGLNVFEYVAGNPIRYVDPLGTCKGVRVDEPATQIAGTATTAAAAANVETAATSASSSSAAAAAAPGHSEEPQQLGSLSLWVGHHISEEAMAVLLRKIRTTTSFGSPTFSWNYYFRDLDRKLWMIPMHIDFAAAGESAGRKISHAGVDVPHAQVSNVISIGGGAGVSGANVSVKLAEIFQIKLVYGLSSDEVMQVFADNNHPALPFSVLKWLAGVIAGQQKKNGTPRFELLNPAINHLIADFKDINLQKPEQQRIQKKK